MSFMRPMAKRRINVDSVEKLMYEMDQHKKEKAELRRDNDALRNQNMMLLESLEAITEENEYWSQEALQSGIVFRLKNVLNQIKQNH